MHTILMPDCLYPNIKCTLSVIKAVKTTRIKKEIRDIVKGVQLNNEFYKDIALYLKKEERISPNILLAHYNIDNYGLL